MKSGTSRELTLITGLIVLTIVGISSGQTDTDSAKPQFKNPEANNAVATEVGAEAKARADYDRAVAVAKTKLIAELEIAKSKATKAGDLDEAIKIRDEIDALQNEIAQPTSPSALGKLARIRFQEDMGYTIAFMEPGVSTHNNAEYPMTEIPAPLLGKGFTQVVAGHPGPVRFGVLTAGKTYICVQIGKDHNAQSAALARIAHLENLPHLKSKSQDWEIWSIVSDAGKEYEIPFQAILVASILEKAQKK